MFILRDLLTPLQTLFPHTGKGQERATWFTYTLLAVLIPLTCSRTSNLFRSLHSLFGRVISSRRCYTFMASPKLPWIKVWGVLWKSIPQPLTQGRLILARDDSINIKTGKKIFACQHFFLIMRPRLIRPPIHGLKILWLLTCFLFFKGQEVMKALRKLT